MQNDAFLIYVPVKQEIFKRKNRIKYILKI